MLGDLTTKDLIGLLDFYWKKEPRGREKILKGGTFPTYSILDADETTTHIVTFCFFILYSHVVCLNFVIIWRKEKKIILSSPNAVAFPDHQMAFVMNFLNATFLEKKFLSFVKRNFQSIGEFWSRATQVQGLVPFFQSSRK